ncbi:MAG: response regulator transcription factor [Prochloraceae cyanobacterium]
METQLDKLCQASVIDESNSPNIVGSFRIRNHHYLVIHLEEIKEKLAKFTNVSLNYFPFFEQGVEVGHFEAHGQHFAIVAADNQQSDTKGNIAEILTDRELQVVKLVAHGHPNKQIASKLKISEWTVSTHIRRVFAKLGVDSRAAMVYQCAFLL